MGAADATLQYVTMTWYPVPCSAMPRARGLCHPLLLARHYCGRRVRSTMAAAAAAAGAWHLAVGTWAGRVDDRRPMQARLHLGGILITLMRAVQAGRLACRPPEHSRTHTRWQDTARSRRQQPATKPANSAGQGRRWLLLIRSISAAGRSCPGQEGAAQQAQESAHVAWPSRAPGCSIT